MVTAVSRWSNGATVSRAVQRRRAARAGLARVHGDLPVLSGAALDNARGAQMVEYAAALVRAETELSEISRRWELTMTGPRRSFWSARPPKW